MQYIVPLTNRPANFYFKGDGELAQIGKTHNDVCIAQLHYTVLAHLGRTEALLLGDDFGQHELTEGMVRLCSALDVANELLERFANPGDYCKDALGSDTWVDGKHACRKWRCKKEKKWRRETEKEQEIQSLESIRNYRNHLVHGRLSPSVNHQFPRLSKEGHYFDWRKVRNPENVKRLDLRDFAGPREILQEAWDITLSYLRDMWHQLLDSDEA